MQARLWVGAIALVACVEYLIAEGVAAAAFTPAYSYAENYISDLGVTRCLPSGPCSPLGAVMNGGLIASGLLALVAACSLGPLVPRPGWRAVLVALVVVYAIGAITVGIVPSAPGVRAGTPHFHIVGAYAAILGGNLAIMLAGATLSSAWASRTFRALSLAAGTAGIASGLALVATRGVPPGLLERGAADTITVWEVASGLLLMHLLAKRGRAGTRA